MLIERNWLLIGIVVTLLIGAGFVITSCSELMLSDYPGLFKSDAMIVVGEDCSQIELETAQAVGAELKELSGNEPIIKNDSEISENDKSDYSLILVGTPDSNNLLQEVYNVTDATRVTKEYPGENKGVLEILRNPWNSEKALLLVAGSNERGVVNGLGELWYLTLSKIKFTESSGKELTIRGTMKEQCTSWAPCFNDCTSAAYFIETESGEIYYLANICSYISLLPGEKSTESKIIVGEPGSLSLLNKQVEAKGKLEKRETVVLLREEPNPPTTTETFDVIIVADLKVLE